MSLRFVFLLAAALVASTASAQTVRNVTIPVRVSDDAINVFIDKHWKRQGWHRFTGNLGGCDYVIELPSPTVTLRRGHGTLSLSVRVSSSNCGGPFQFSLSPSIAISSGQISTAKVKMWLLDLKDWIDDLSVPDWVTLIVRHELERRWGIPDLDDNVDAFPASLVKGITTPFLDQRSVNFYYSNPFEFAWGVEDGFLVLTPSVNFQAGQGATVGPDFKTRLFLGDTDWLDIWSNIKAKVATAGVFSVAGYLRYRVDPGVYTIKYHGNPQTEWIAINLNDSRLAFNQIYFVWVLFEIDRTFYVRKYRVLSGANVWHGAAEGYN